MPRKPKWLIVVSNFRHNLLARWRLHQGNVSSDIGATHAHLSAEQSVEYINRVFSDYLRFGGLTTQHIQGKRVLELGPGDNLGVALRFYCAGASEVVCLDKFYSKRDTDKQISIYRNLRETLSPAERVRYDEAIDLQTGEIDAERVQYVCGRAAEEAAQVFDAHSFDLVVSRAVLWEIFHIDTALRALDAVLRPGGTMIHKVACIDWMFRQEGYHPLEFLTLPDPVYQWMAADSGKSNRRTIDYYRREFKTLGYRAQFHVTKIVGAIGADWDPGVVTLVQGIHYGEDTLHLIAEIRPRLLPRFRQLSNEDLMTEDMFIVAEKTNQPFGAASQMTDGIR